MTLFLSYRFISAVAAVSVLVGKCLVFCPETLLSSGKDPASFERLYYSRSASTLHPHHALLQKQNIPPPPPQKDQKTNQAVPSDSAADNLPLTKSASRGSTSLSRQTALCTTYNTTNKIKLI